MPRRSNNTPFPAETTTFSYGNSAWPDELTSVNGTNLTYDANGNVLTYGNMEFEWANTQLEITNVNDIKIMAADLSNARHANNWSKDAPSDTAVLAGPIEILFDNFKPTFHYGYICKSNIGWYLLGAWQTDIDDYYSIEQKMFLLSADVQRKLDYYLNRTS